MNLDALIGDIYEAALEPARWPQVLAALRQLAASQGAGLMFGHPTGAKVGIAVGHSPESDADYDAYYNALDPLIPYGWGRPAGTWSNDWRVVGARFERTEYYNDFYRKHGWHACTAVTLHMDEHFWACASFQRAAGMEPFDDEVERRLDPVVPHLRRAFRLHREMEALRLKGCVSELVLASLEVAAWVVDGWGRIQFANAAAEAAMTQRAVVEGASGRLRTLEDVAGFEAAVRSATSASGARASWVRLPHAAQTLTVLPVPGTALAIGRVALVMLRGSDRPAALVEALRAIYRLAPREAEIACRIAAGARPKDVADALQLSGETVRTYLKSVYAKTGWRSQAELARSLQGLLVAHPR